eukprot:801248-Heterocapsa_arctica.AAC.1
MPHPPAGSAAVLRASWVWAAAMMLVPMCSLRVLQTCTGMPLPVMRWGPKGSRHPSDPMVKSYMLLFAWLCDAESMTPCS